MSDITELEKKAMMIQELSEFEERQKLVKIIVGSDALAKACFDNCFDYALKLRTGEVIRFTGAEIINNEWIHLTLDSWLKQAPENRLPFTVERGVDVRLADIVWVMDAPEGS